MASSFFFYDLETSGISASQSRIMQFAGQRIDEHLQPIGEPVNLLITLAGDVLPDPDAVMLTGITPQSTIVDGLSEAEFLEQFYSQVVQPDTIFLGYNTIRFDDEFMRYLHYRNFYDPYEWQWQNGCSRWDLLDVVRMTRALRPEGISWPVTDAGKPTNRLELLTIANQLSHDQAHDALSDVTATIALAQLIKAKQPDLFSYLLQHKDKQAVAELVEKGQAFVYSSGRYPGQWQHTTAAILLTKGDHGSAIVYDLRHDPRPFMKLSVEELIDAWQYKKDRPDDFVRLPIKTLKYNRCPAVAPLGVIKDDATQARLELSLDTINQNVAYLRAGFQEFVQRILAAVEQLDRQRADKQSDQPVVTPETVDGLLYQGFFGSGDKQAMADLRANKPARPSDKRLQQLQPLYKARNYPASLSADERQQWEQHVSQQLFTGGQQSRLSQYFARLQELAQGTLSSQQEYLLEELQLYGESIMPSDIDISEQ